MGREGDASGFVFAEPDMSARNPGDLFLGELSLHRQHWTGKQLSLEPFGKIHPNPSSCVD